MLFVWSLQSEEGLNALASSGRTVLIDSTHCMTSSGRQLFNVAVVDRNNGAVIACSFLPEKNNAVTVEACLQFLRARFREKFNAELEPDSVMMDDCVAGRCHCSHMTRRYQCCY